MIIDLTLGCITLKGMHEPLVLSVRFGFAQQRGETWLKAMQVMGEDGAVDGHELLNQSVDGHFEATLSTTHSSYYPDKHVFEGYGNVLGDDRTFAVEVWHSGRITVSIWSADKQGIVLDPDDEPEIAPQRLPLPPRTAWDRLDDLDTSPTAPSVPVASLAPGWGDDFG